MFSPVIVADGKPVAGNRAECAESYHLHRQDGSSRVREENLRPFMNKMLQYVLLEVGGVDKAGNSCAGNYRPYIAGVEKLLNYKSGYTERNQHGKSNLFNVRLSHNCA